MFSASQQPYVVIGPPSSSSHPQHSNPTRTEPRSQVDRHAALSNGVRHGFSAPSVDEALPYSPLTSIVPFSPNVLPFPGPPHIKGASLFSSEEERKRARNQLSLLSSEVKNPHRNSALLEQSLRKLQTLLNPNNLAEYKFKTLRRNLPSRHTSQQPNGGEKMAKPALTPFTKLIMDKNEVAYRYPTPEASPKRQQRSETARDTKLQQRSYSSKPVKTQNPNGSTEVRVPVHGQPIGKPKIKQQEDGNQPLVVVGALPRASQHEYVVYAEPKDETFTKDTTPSKKRKRDNGGPVDVRIDHRERKDAALDHVNDVITNLLDAEENFETDNTELADIFQSDVIGHDNKPILTRSAQRLLDSAIQKASASFEFIALDDLIRLQKLCEPSVTAIETYSLAIGDDPGDDDVQEWIDRLDLAECGLYVGRTVLRILTAGREEKQLYSEDLLVSMLRSIDYVLNMAIIPAVESRPTGSSAGAFKVYAANQKSMVSLLQALGKILRLFGDLAAKVEIADEAITKLENMAICLIFVENPHFEKDSCLGIQRFENLRRTAMDVLTKLFSRYPVQRPSIFNEILSSLEKLPVTRQSARQYKIVDGKPIQLVSALLMRLVQASATKSTGSKSLPSRVATADDADAEGEDDDSDDSAPIAKSRPYALGGADSEDMLASLKEAAEPLIASSWKAASYVMKHLLDRGMTSSKSGDQPYRNLLDIFTEDFISVVGSPDWPAAQVLLRALLMMCVKITDEEKQPVPAKNLALDLMGVMGSGISDLQIGARSSHRSIDATQSELAQRLDEYTSMLLDDGVNDFDLIKLDGPFRMVIDYLDACMNDSQAQSARGCFLSLWAKTCMGLADGENGASVPKKMLFTLRNMIEDPNWLQGAEEQQSVSTSQGRIASVIIALTSDFGRSQPRILNTIFRFMTSQIPTLRNRSLKSAQQLIERDPSILDRTNVALKQVINCSSDQSSLVRDSALQLLSKFLLLKPQLEKQAYPRIVQLSGDEAIQVRKRAMKVLKDIYTRNDAEDIKATIAAGLILRVKDHDEGVADLARQIFDELWMIPLHGSASKDKVAHELTLQKQASLIVKTSQQTESSLVMLEALLESMLSNDAKNAAANFKVSKSIVAAMFDAIIDNEDRPDRPSQLHLTRTLTVFAKVRPKLFTTAQLNLLATYIKNLKTSDNLQMFVPVVSIYRHVFPTLMGSLGNDFLRTVQTDLLASITTLPKSVLLETAMCLWITGELLENQDKIVNLISSVIISLNARKDKDLLDPANEKDASAVRRYIQLSGPFGKACNLDIHAETIKKKIPSWKGASVSGLIIDTICNFTRQKQPQAVREVALESVAMICQAWPQNYLRLDVTKAFDLVFRNDDSKLKQIVLSGIREFMAQEEKRSESGADIKVGGGTEQGQERLAKSFVPTDNDGATTTIAQQFLPHIVRIALSADDELALLAVYVVASVNRQGLVHPKECGPPLIALETSPNKAIATLAFEEHRRLHHKHESMFEKEYIKTVYQTFTYQRDVFSDPRGVVIQVGQPTRAKLGPLFEVLKLGNAKLRKRFLTNLTGRVNFELGKLDTKGAMPDTVLFARFAMENLAVFEYPKMDELLALVTALEKMVVAGTGTTVAHAIELDILRVRLEENKQPQQIELNGFGPDSQLVTPQLPAKQPVDPARLRQLTVASMILLLAWETRTHIRYLWGLQKHGKNVTVATKDLNKAPTKALFVQTDKAVDKYLEKAETIMSALDTESSQLQLVKQFAELLAIDHEVKVGEHEEEEADMNGDADEDGPDLLAGKNRKRKGSVGPSTPNSKRRKSANLNSAQKKSGGSSKGGKKRSGSRSRAGSSASADDDEDGGWD